MSDDNTHQEKPLPQIATEKLTGPLKDLVHAVLTHDEEACRTLLAERPDVLFYRLPLTDGAYTTPLHLVATGGDVPIGELFLNTMRKLGKDPDFFRDQEANTAHHEAAEHGHTPFIDFLIYKGSSAFVRNAVMALPLHDAATLGHTSVMSLYTQICSPAILLDQNRQGETTLHRAAIGAQPGAARLVLETADSAKSEFPLLAELPKLVSHSGYTAYDMVCWQLLNSEENADDNTSDHRDRLEEMRNALEQLNAAIHSPLWFEQKTDRLRKLYHAIAHADMLKVKSALKTQGKSLGKA